MTPTEPLGEGLKRVFSEELDRAAQNLAVREGAARDEAIHDARKSVKKTRAVLRMVKPHLGTAFDRENKLLRSIGKNLSGLRDAAALIETLDGLHESGLKKIRASLVERKERASISQATLTRAVSNLQRMQKRAAVWDLTPNGFKLIEPGLRTIYKRGRKALATAEEVNDPVVWHTFRKRVKDHWYHVRLIEDISRAKLKSRKKDLNRLETALGAVHNLVVLGETIQGHPPPSRSGELAIAMALIDKAQNRLHAEALRIADKLYDEKPRKFIQSLNA